MRRVIIVITLLMTTTSFAGNVTPESASRAAQNYVAYSADMGTWDGAASANVILARVLTWENTVVGYYFEVDPDGWLLVPAFRELPPIKAYSEHGHLEFDYPEAFGTTLETILQAKAATLARYPDRLSLAEAGIDLAAIDRYGKLWDIYTEPDRDIFFDLLTENQLDEYIPGSYMVDTIWHQGSPYNNYCPTIDQHHCWVGCAATAAAQIMNYWQWPPYGIGGHSYLWQGQTLSADFSDPYDWDNIRLVYGNPGDHTPEELHAVAELSYEVGVSFDMDYGLDGSGILVADVAVVVEALRDYFGYQDIMDFEYRNAYANNDMWFAMLQEELDLERPMWYYIYGHVIVCDGWRVSNFINQIHINYGVGGSGNGWFGLDEIPGSTDPSYEFVIRHIEPLPSMPQVINWEEQQVAGGLDGASSVHAEDIDGDGDLDILGAANSAGTVAWWENLDGNATSWSEHSVDAAFTGARSVFAADMDGDGDQDILGAAAGSDIISWWENLNGTGTQWSEHVAGVFVDAAYCVTAMDMDGDTDMDILGASNDGDYIKWWENVAGNGLSWAGHSVGSNFDGARSAIAADIDGDSDLDVVGAGYFAQDIRWWENLDGTGTNWNAHLVEGAFGGAYGVHSADIDDDGDLDILGAGSIVDEICCWENVNGDGTSWTQHVIGSQFDGAGNVYSADVDLDGDLDILGSAYNSDDISWWENPGDFVTSWTKHRVAWLADGANDAHAADLDADGDIDLLGAAFMSDNILIWRQSGSPEPPGPVTITLNPTVVPTVVPRGGWFSYDMQMDVNLNQPTIGYVWTTATLPGGQEYGPVFDVQFIFAPGMSLNVTGIQQSVPAIAPLGDYQWSVHAGLNMQNPIASDSFPFTVVAAGSNMDSPARNWTSNGEELILQSTHGSGDGVVMADNPPLAAGYAINHAYPNPFNAETSVSIHLPETADLDVVIFNVSGQQVATLASGSFNAGTHRFSFDAGSLASGLYFMRTYVPGQIDQTQKLLLVR